MNDKPNNFNSKNLTLNERFLIESYLKEGLTFTEISTLLNRSRKTISREIKNRRFAKTKDPKLKKSKCAYLKTCNLMNLCNHSYCKGNRLCSKCIMRTCSQYCDTYVPGTCPKLLKPPYVCNGCNYPRTCGYDKMYYRAKYADDKYHHMMSESRKGIDLSPEELYELDQLISPLLLRGQSIAHIYTAHKHDIKCSKRTLYNYIDLGILQARNIDLPRKVRYKPRKKHVKRIKIDQTYRKERTYSDFMRYTELNSGLNVVEMDIVEGRKGGKVILTLFFRNCNLMPMFLLESNTQEQVISVFRTLAETLGTDGMRSAFPVILTDNGPEFKDPWSIEKDEYGDERTKVFYCEPYKSWQKARIEKNHEFIRYIVSKGKSFDHLKQEDVTLMANHINSIARASLNGKTPFELANILLSKNLISTLELEHVPHDEVLVKPILLKK